MSWEKGFQMSATGWILLAIGVWLVAMGALYVCARGVRDVDRAQTDVLAGERLARFTHPRARRLRKTGRRRAGRSNSPRDRTSTGG